MPTQRRTQDLALSEKPLAQSSEGLGDASDPKFCARGGENKSNSLLQYLTSCTTLLNRACAIVYGQMVQRSPFCSILRPVVCAKRQKFVFGGDTNNGGENLGAHYQNKALCRRPTQKSGTPS